MSIESPEGGATLRPHPKCLLTELDDGTGVILNLETKYYFTLNATGVVLWKALEGGARTPQEIVARLVGEFEVEEAEALADVRAVLDELLSEQLVESLT